MMAGIDRRHILQGAVWSVPAVTLAAALPAAAGTGALDPEQFGISSAFGVGWYPFTVSTVNDGYLQFDGHSDKFFRVTGLQPGDVVSNISMKLYIGAGFAPPSFASMPESDARWTLPVRVGTGTVEFNGEQYYEYQTFFHRKRDCNRVGRFITG